MGIEDYAEELRERGFGETGDWAVCLSCILDEGLRRQVAPHLTEDACTFCGREAEDDISIAADFKVLMEPVMDAIQVNVDTIKVLTTSFHLNMRHPRLRTELLAMLEDGQREIQANSSI
jgi:hypothetical protein